MYNDEVPSRMTPEAKERVRVEALALFKTAFPKGENWPKNLRGLQVLLEDRYKLCKKEKIKFGDPRWFVYVGRMFIFAKKQFPNTQGLKYLDGMRTVLNVLMRLDGSFLPRTRKRKQATDHYKLLKSSFEEVT